MPGKSRHGKGKHSLHRKRKKGRQRFPATVAVQPAAAQTSQPAAPTWVPTPPVSVPTRMKTPTPARYPYITAELRRIGILAGIMLVILIVLALVLS